MSLLSLPVATLGTPRIGPRRELKLALEAYWAGKLSEKQLLEAAAGLRAADWARQKSLGVTVIPSNDFSLYDHVLDTSVMVGAIPEVYGWKAGPVTLNTYFAMARGAQGDDPDAGCGHAHHGHGAAAQEMTKWFDTNYHYMVPEFHRAQTFKLASRVLGKCATHILWQHGLLAGSYNKVELPRYFQQVIDFAGTVGWARTTDLLFHRQAL